MNIIKKDKKETDVATENLSTAGESTGSATTRTEAPTVFGINKKMSIGIVGLIGVVFIAALVSTFSTPSKKDMSNGINNKDTGLGMSSEIQRPGGNLPGNYGELAKYNQKQSGATSTAPVNASANGSANANGQVNASHNGNPSGQYSAAPTGNSGYSGGQSNYSVPPQIPQQQNYGQPVLPNYSALQQPQQVQQAQPVAPVENYNSPVRFSLAGIASAVANAIGGQANPAAPANGVQQSSPVVVGYARPVGNTLNAGSIIPAVLLSGINSDLPGQVVAQVRQDVYDSVSGDVLLIPQGSRLIGEYGGKIGPSQERIGVIWKVIIFPNGASFTLGNNGMASIDSSGYVGIQDKVNNHTGQIFGTAILTSALSAVATIASGNANVASGATQSAGQLAASGATTSLINAATKMLEKQSDVQPTITVRPGMWFDVFVGQSLVLEPYN